jgi:hypothetical protein
MCYNMRITSRDPRVPAAPFTDGSRPDFQDRRPMAQPTTILAHDLGTTGDKATLFDAATGAPVAATFEPYPTAYPHPNWAEQDPADWQIAVFQGTRRLLEKAGVAPANVAAISFSGTMQGALLVDAAGRAPTPLHHLGPISAPLPNRTPSPRRAGPTRSIGSPACAPARPTPRPSCSG